MFERYGFEPLQTPAFERLETLTGKYGDEGDKLIFKILRRGEHEATGEADLALRYDMTVPLARVVAGYGSQLPTPYKRYAMGPVWRADRPGRGRFREFAQCDVDVVGSASPLADAEVVCALTDALGEVGVRDYRVLVNSRGALSGLLEVYGVPADLGGDYGGFNWLHRGGLVWPHLKIQWRLDSAPVQAISDKKGLVTGGANPDRRQHAAAEGGATPSRLGGATWSRQNHGRWCTHHPGQARQALPGQGRCRVGRRPVAGPRHRRGTGRRSDGR
ncbi:hypothetical protein GCM10009735_20100 [Actinomadura chokoriensis]